MSVINLDKPQGHKSLCRVLSLAKVKKKSSVTSFLFCSFEKIFFMTFVV